MRRLKRNRVAAGLLAASVLFPAGAQAQVATIEHRWGQTVVAEVPERIVSLSYTGIDTFLALGLTPVAYRGWYGGNDRGLWPWATDRMPPDSEALVLRGEIDAESVARLRPDLVEAMYSGLSHAQYAALSHLVPVLPALEGRGDFGTPWDEMLRVVGRATGRQGEARSIIADIEMQIASVRRAHPEWRGKTAIVARLDGPLIFSEIDPRMTLISRLGFRLPAAADALSLNNFYFKLDRELTAPLDADVVIWLDYTGDRKSLDSHPLRSTLRPVLEGREIFLGTRLSAALNYASPLSIPYALERLVPMLEAALDGDPATPVSDTRSEGTDP